MPRPGPRRPNTAVRLSKEQTNALDAIAKRQKVKRSDVIRQAIDQYLADDFRLYVVPSAHVIDDLDPPPR